MQTHEKYIQFAVDFAFKHENHQVDYEILHA